MYAKYIKKNNEKYRKFKSLSMKCKTFCRPDVLFLWMNAQKEGINLFLNLKMENRKRANATISFFITYFDPANLLIASALIRYQCVVQTCLTNQPKGQPAERQYSGLAPIPRKPVNTNARNRIPNSTN